MVLNPCICQMEATEADGFQADTEEDDEEDCVIIATQNSELNRRNKKLIVNL